MSLSQSVTAILVLVAIAILMGGAIFEPFSRTRSSNQWKAQIVRHGCGDFAITDTLTGETEFQWRKP